MGNRFTLKDYQKTETDKFDVNAYKNSELTVFLERKYSYSVNQKINSEMLVIYLNTMIVEYNQTFLNLIIQIYSTSL
jgi:hypothetical protein